jgi:hypothetical protein
MFDKTEAAQTDTHLCRFTLFRIQLALRFA